MSEAIWERQASDVSPPSPYQQNMSRESINSIWYNHTLEAIGVGYFAYDDANSLQPSSLVDQLHF